MIKTRNVQNELAETLKECRVDILENITPPEIAWELRVDDENFIPLGTNGNFSLVKGKAKSKKTFFINMAIATTVGGEILHNTLRAPFKEEPKQVLYFDTEQSKYHLQTAVKRVCTQIGTTVPRNLEAYGLRKKSPSERLKIVEHAIQNTPNLSFVVIDGIRDLITCINDEAEASHIASKLLKWTEEQNIHIIAVLHENPGSDKARGHIGTELMNKAETVLGVEVDKSNTNVSIVKAAFCRNKSFDPFAFEITEEGLPQIIQDYEAIAKSTRKGFDLSTLADTDKFKILEEVFKTEKEFGYGVLEAQIKVVLVNKHKGTAGKGQAKIKSLITDAKNKGWLKQSQSGKPYSLGSLPV